MHVVGLLLLLLRRRSRARRVQAIIQIAAIYAVAVLDFIQGFNQTQQELLAGFVQGFKDFGVALDDRGDFLDQGDLGTRVFREAVVALDDVLQKSLRRLRQLVLDHEVQNVGHCEVAFRLHAQVLEAFFVHEDLLDDERGHGLRELGPPLHNAQTQWNDLSFDQKVDDSGIVNLDQGADHAKRRQPEVLEAAAFAHRVQKRKGVEVNIGLQEEVPRILVTGDRLQQSQHIARFIGRLAIEQRRGEQRVHRYDLQQQSGYGAHRVPNKRRQLLEVLSLA